jgi:hypothetical protein
LPGYSGNPAAGCQGKDFAYISIGTMTDWRTILCGKIKLYSF